MRALLIILWPLTLLALLGACILGALWRERATPAAPPLPAPAELPHPSDIIAESETQLERGRDTLERSAPIVEAARRAQLEGWR